MSARGGRDVPPGLRSAGSTADPAVLAVSPLADAALATEREAIRAATLVAIFVLVPAAVAATAVLVLFVLSLAVVVAPALAVGLTWLAWHCNRRSFGTPLDPR